MRLLCFVSFALLTWGAHAQSIYDEIVSGYGSSDGRKTEWVVGGIINEVMTGENSTLSSGLHNITFLLVTNTIGTEDPGQVTVFPNPVKEILTIAAPGYTGNCEIELFDNLTRRISISEKWANDRATVDVNHLNSGLYLLQVTNIKTKKTSFIKVIKE